MEEREKDILNEFIKVSDDLQGAKSVLKDLKAKLFAIYTEGEQNE